MKTFMKAIFIALPFALMVGCSDDDDNTIVPPTNDFLALTHNYFDYSNVLGGSFREFRTDVNNGEVDGTEVSGTFNYDKDTLVNGKTARLYIRTENSGDAEYREYSYMTLDSNEYYINSGALNDIVYTISAGTGLQINLPFILPDMMIKIGDRKNTSWTSFTQDFNNFEVTNYAGTSVTASGNLTVKGTRGQAEIISTETSKEYSQYFNILITFDGTISLDPATKRTLIAYFSYKFTEGKGITKVSVPFSTFDIMTGLSYPLNGFTRIITLNK